MYRKTIHRYMKDAKYALVPEDFNDVKCEIGDGGQLKFFELEKHLQEKCGVPLRQGKKHHRWGYHVLLFKHKAWTQIDSCEVTVWDQMKWRPIVSTFRNHYKPWYSFSGRFFTE